jgi:hypothetical protein
MVCSIAISIFTNHPARRYSLHNHDADDDQVIVWTLVPGLAWFLADRIAVIVMKEQWLCSETAKLLE